MFDSTTLILFITAALALLITPGPAVLYIVARSIDQGRWAGIVSVLGVQVGAAFHIGAAAIGISAVLASSALAFSVIKLIGAGYLIYLGVRKLLEPTPEINLETPPPQPYGRIFRQGMIVNILNPKTALFFFAFLPQFINPDSGSAVAQIVVLGLLFIGLAICSDSTYAMLAGTLGNWLRRSRAWAFGQKYVAGSIYITLGAITARAR